jgi:hypothetical protein
MRFFLKIMFSVLLAGSIELYGQTDVSGTIDGATWSAAGSPYRVNGDLDVQDLTIEPGVDVNFTGAYEFSVTGTLKATGTRADSITFQNDSGFGGNWKGIIIENTSFSDSLNYVRVSGASPAGITVMNDQTYIEHCRISGISGDGILLDGGSADIFRSGLHDNTQNGLKIINNGRALLTAVRLHSNDFKGITLNKGRADLENVIVSSNGQGGIILNTVQDTLNFTNTVIASHGTNYGIFATNGSITGKNSIIYYNTPSVLAAGGVDISYSDIEGLISGTQNFDSDPQFADLNSYILASGSPCIDRGDPAQEYNDVCFPPSLQSERNDAGAYGGPGASEWYDQLVVFPGNLDFGQVTVNDTRYDTVRVKNYRDYSLEITSVHIADDSQGFFTYDTNNIGIDGFDSALVVLGFTPRQLKNYSTDLAISSTGGNAAVPLSGRGVIPNIDVTVTSLDFGAVSVGDSDTDTLMVLNAGIGNLHITKVNFENPAYSLLDNLPIDLKTFDQFPLRIRFEPDTIHEITCEMEIISNDPDTLSNPLKISLSGSGKAPIISFSPADSIKFSGTSAGSADTLDLVMTNAGNDTLKIFSHRIEPVSTYFSLIDTSLQTVFLPGANDTIMISFRPDSMRTYSANLSVSSNDPFNNKNPYKIILTGKGISPVAQIEPSDSVLFDQVIFNTMASKSLTIKNVGNSGLRIGPYTLDPGNNVFKIDDYPAGTTIAPEDSVNFGISFNPEQKNTSYSATLMIPTNEIGQDSLRMIRLRGNSVLPVLNKPDSVDFGAIAVKEQSSREVILKNTGTGTLIIDSLYLNSAGDDAFTFTVDSLPAYLKSNPDSLKIGILFSPQTKGDFNSKIYISTNLPDTLQIDSLFLHGTAQKPVLQLSTNTLTFDTTLIRSADTDTVSISNRGDGTLTIASVFFTEMSDSSDFKLSSPAGALNFPIHIEADKKYTLLVKFEPDSIEKTERRAGLLIYSNDPDSSVRSISLSGFAMSPVNIQVDNSLVFDPVFLDQKDSIYLKIGNPGGHDILTIREIEFEGSAFRADLGSEISIEPDSTASLKVVFAPDRDGPLEDTLSIVSNDPINDTVFVSLAGTGRIDSSTAKITFSGFSDSLVSGSDYHIKVQINGTEAPVTWCYFMARPGAYAFYDTLRMNQVAGTDSFKTVLPGFLITERGLEYYIDVRHGGSLTCWPDKDSPGYPVYTQVTIPELKYPAPTRANEYQIISLPVESDGKTLDSLFGDILGTYNDTQYRMFDCVSSDNTYDYVELTGMDRLLPRGKAYWLITRNSKELAVENVKSPANLDTFSIPLRKGWNLIGVPFPFPVSKESIDLSMIGGSTFFDRLIEDWDYKVTILKPYSGYAVFALDSTILRIPPVAADYPEGAAKYAASQGHTAKWEIVISASRGRYMDSQNIAGVLENALDGFDRYDVPEPPSPGNFVSVYFHNPEIPLTADFRAPADSAAGYRFGFSVVSNFSGTTALTVDDKNLPSGYKYTIVSDETSVRYDDPNSIRITAERQDFTLLVGSEDFIERSVVSYSAPPANYTLYQNYPNPFNPETTIKYSLPAAGKTDLVIYDILGRIVRKLQSGELMEAGYHAVIWDGTNDRHEPVASGIYFLALRTPAYHHTIKMLLQR